MENTNQTKPLVSVIVPAFNAERYIIECVDSVLSQSYTNFEVLVADDCSTDQTIRLVESIQDKRVKLYKLTQNSGVGVARNLAIGHAQGRYIAFLDADDMWLPNKLEVQVGLMEKNGVDFTFSSYEIMDENSKSKNILIVAPKRVDYSEMLKNNYIGCLTVMYNQESLGKTKMPEFRKRQDWGLWLLLLTKTTEAIGIQEPLALYRKGQSSLSSNKVKLLKTNFNFYRKHLGFSAPKSLFLIARFLIYFTQYKRNNTIQK